MAQNHFIPDMAKQTMELVYDELLNQGTNDCWNRFYCPDYISLDSDSAGLRYVGNMKGNTNFMIIRSEEQFSQYLGNPTKVKIMNKSVLAMYVADQRIIKLRDAAPGYNDIKSGKIRAIFSNPLDVPDYNYDTSIFPIDSNSLNTLINAIFVTLRLSAYGKADEVADGSDTGQLAQLSRFLANQFVKQSNPAMQGI